MAAEYKQLKVFDFVKANPGCETTDVQRFLRGTRWDAGKMLMKLKCSGKIVSQRIKGTKTSKYFMVDGATPPVDGRGVRAESRIGLEAGWLARPTREQYPYKAIAYFGEGAHILDECYAGGFNSRFPTVDEINNTNENENALSSQSV